jgi:hypothetical protein
MNDISYPFELAPGAYGTNFTFCGEEEGRWTVQISVRGDGDDGAKRVQLTFIGVAEARINDAADRSVTGACALMQISQSVWVQQFLKNYVIEFGSALLPVVTNVQHFIVRGPESAIGVLARKVECSAVT